MKLYLKKKNSKKANPKVQTGSENTADRKTAKKSNGPRKSVLPEVK